jgi:hypothetical protein
MSDWYLGVPKTLTFTIGPIDSGDVVYLDYWRITDMVVTSLTSTIVDLVTGSCTAQFTPLQTGCFHFWPRVMTVGGVIRNIGTPKTLWVYTPGTIPPGAR